MGTTRNARIAGEEVSDETPEGQGEVRQVSLPGQGGGRVQGEEGQVSRLPPEPPDIPAYSDVCHQEFPGVQEGILVSIPMKGGGQVRQQGAHVQGEVTRQKAEGDSDSVPMQGGG